MITYVAVCSPHAHSLNTAHVTLTTIHLPVMSIHGEIDKEIHARHFQNNSSFNDVLGKLFRNEMCVFTT